MPPIEGQEAGQQELNQEQQDDGTLTLADAFADDNEARAAAAEDDDSDADAEMAAAYAETRGVEPPATTTAAPGEGDTPVADVALDVDDPATAEALKAADAEAAQAAEAEAAKPAAAGASPQPAAGAEPTLAQVLEQLTALNSRVRNTEGHIGGLNSTLKTLAAAKAAATTTGGSAAAPSQADITAAAEDPESLKQLCEDFPAFGDALKASVAHAETRILAKAGGSIDMAAIHAAVREQVMADVQPLIRGEIEAARAEVAVVTKYPDFHERVKKPEFGTWLQKQAPEVRALADSTKAADAIALIDRHQKHVDTLAAAARRRNRLTNAVLPRSTAAGGPPVLDDDAAMQAGYSAVRGGR